MTHDRRILLAGGAAALLAVLAFSWAGRPAAAQAPAPAQKAPGANEYVLEVEGTAGVRLDMLLITNWRSSTFGDHLAPTYLDSRHPAQREPHHHGSPRAYTLPSGREHP